MALWWNCDAVYCGFWKNEGNAYMHRGTLTLPNQWGLILVGFFTLFIKLSSSYLWGAIKFTIHQLNASNKPRNASYHQLQLLLHNTESESTLIAQLTKVLWAHRGRRPKLFGKGLALILFAGLYTIAFAITSGLSSRIIHARDSSVLSVPKHCGWFKEPTIGNSSSISSGGIFESANAISVMARNVYRRSASYSRSCYGRFGDNSTACENYVLPTLPYVLRKDVPCPFADKACNGSAMSLDTGHLRSDVHLGINTPSRDALSVRKVLTCVPLAGEQYTDGWQQMTPAMLAAQGLPLGTSLKGYSFGRTSGIFGSFNVANYTAAMDDVHWKFGKQSYSLKWTNNIVDLPPIPAWFPFVPIADLRNTSADTIVIGLTNRNDFASPIADPWFAADNCSTSSASLLSTTCRASNPLSFLGCQEQYQFCKTKPLSTTHITEAPSTTPPASDACTPLSGLYRLYPDIFLAKGSPWNGTTLTDMTPSQSALYIFLAKILSSSQLHFQLGFIGHENLIAQDSLWDGGFGFSLSAALPETQWQIEVHNWMNVSLSNTQRGTVTYARPSEFDIGNRVSSLDYMEHPQDTDLRRLCDRVKIRSAMHTSFSVLAMALTIALGVLCILSDFLVRRVVFSLQRRWKHGTYKQRQWSESSAFQLQRMAAEGAGIGPWTGTRDGVPVLVEKARVFCLDGDHTRGCDDGGDGDNGVEVRYRALCKDAKEAEMSGPTALGAEEARCK